MAKSKRPQRIKDVGTIYYDSSGNQYIGQVEIGRYENGRIKYKRFKGKTKADVKCKMIAFKSKESTHESIIQEKEKKHSSDDILLSDYLKSYVETYKVNRLKPTSYNRDTLSMQNISKYIGDYHLSELTTEIVQLQLINALLKDNYSFSTIHKCYVLLNESLRIACYKELINKNVCNFVVMPSKKIFKEKEIRFLDDNEIERLKSVVSKSNHQNDIIILIMLYTGL